MGYVVFLLIVAGAGFFAYKSGLLEKFLDKGNGDSGGGVIEPQKPAPGFKPFEPEVKFYSMPTGRHYDYAVDGNTGKGYLLSVQNHKQLMMSEFDPITGHYSDYEMAIGNGPAHNLQFNRPRTCISGDFVYIAWGDRSRKNNGLFWTRKHVVSGGWDSKRHILENNHIEFFNFTGKGNGLRFLAFSLDPEGALLVNEAGDLLEHKKNLVFKDLEVMETKDDTPIFLGRFRKVTQVVISGDRMRDSLLGYEMSEPTGLELENGSDVHVGWKWANRGSHKWWPSRLHMKGPAGLVTIKDIPENDGHDSSAVAAATEVGGVLRVVYDYKDQIYLYNAQTREHKALGQGSKPVVRSYGRERCDIVCSSGVYQLYRP